MEKTSWNTHILPSQTESRKFASFLKHPNRRGQEKRDSSSCQFFRHFVLHHSPACCKFLILESVFFQNPEKTARYVRFPAVGQKVTAKPIDAGLKTLSSYLKSITQKNPSHWKKWASHKQKLVTFNYSAPPQKKQHEGFTISRVHKQLRVHPELPTLENSYVRRVK